jgi:hypothetical protein
MSGELAPRQVRQGTRWEDAYARRRQVAPDAVDRGRVRNLWNGDWQLAGDLTEATSPVDGQPASSVWQEPRREFPCQGSTSTMSPTGAGAT